MSNWRKRKQAKRAREAAEALEAATSQDPTNIVREGSDRVADVLLRQKAIRENWLGVEFWEADQTAEELRREVEQRGGLTLLTKVKLKILRDLDHENPGVRIATARNVLTMVDHDNKHRLNAKRESGIAGAGVAVNVQINNNNGDDQDPSLPPGYRIVAREDFYGNNAHELERERDRRAGLDAAGSDALPVAGTPLAGAVQDADLWAQIREDQHRSNGDTAGPRPHDGNGSAGTNGRG